MAIVDYTSGKLLGLASIGDSPDAAGYDEKTGLAFSSNGGSATLSVIDASKPGYPTVQTVTTAKGARTMTLEASTGRVYLVTAQFGPVPAATPTTPRPRASAVPGSFEVLVVEKYKTLARKGPRFIIAGLFLCALDEGEISSAGSTRPA